MATKAPPAPAAGCVQAVDGVNGKIGALGGVFGNFGNKTLGEAEGALAVPLGCEFGAQVDLNGGSFDGRFLGTAAGHLFWRDPSRGLLGAYGDYTKWNELSGVRVGHVGPEAEGYFGRWTVQGVAGAEFGNSTSGTVGSVIDTFDIRTRFFDEVNLAYYATDDLELYVGHRYLGGRNAAAFGGEWGVPLGRGVMGALFAEATAGEKSDHGVWAGVRLYIGQKDKTLIRRHREDDPTNWNNGPSSVGNSGSQTGAPTGPTSCPMGFHLFQGTCVQNH